MTELNQLRWLSLKFGALELAMERMGAQLEALGAPAGFEALRAKKQRDRETVEARRQAWMAVPDITVQTRNTLIRAGVAPNDALAHLRGHAIRGLGRKGREQLERALGAAPCA